MFGLCKYRNIFGKPGKGLHRFRIFGLAAVDIALTFVLAWLVHMLALVQYSYWQVLLGCFALGMVMHRIFCGKTPIDRFLFR